MQARIFSLALLLPLVATVVLGQASPVIGSSPTATTRDGPAAPAPGTASAPPTTPNNATPGLNIPNLVALRACGENCTVKAAKAAGCKNKEDTACWCKSQKFADSAYKCIQKECKEAIPFVYPQYKAGCEAGKQEITFKWPDATNGTAAAGPGAATNASTATDNTTSTTNGTATTSSGAASEPAGAAGQGVDLAFGLMITAISVSMGAALVA